MWQTLTADDAEAARMLAALIGTGRGRGGQNVSISSCCAANSPNWNRIPLPPNDSGKRFSRWQPTCSHLVTIPSVAEQAVLLESVAATNGGSMSHPMLEEARRKCGAWCGSSREDQPQPGVHRLRGHPRRECRIHLPGITPAPTPAVPFQSGGLPARTPRQHRAATAAP